MENSENEKVLRPGEPEGAIALPVEGVVPLDQIRGDDEEDTKLLQEMAQVAGRYLRTFRWCKEVRSGYFGDGVGGVVAMFLFDVIMELDGANSNEWLWVFIGDIPSAFMLVGEFKTPYLALERYIEGLSEWVKEAEHGHIPSGLIPIDYPPTPEFVEMFKKRVELLRTYILPNLPLL